MGEIIEQDGRKFFKAHATAPLRDVTRIDVEAEPTLENFPVLPTIVQRDVIRDLTDKAESAVQLARESQAKSAVECKERLDLLHNEIMPLLTEQLRLAIQVTNDFLNEKLHDGMSPTTALRHINRVRKAAKDLAEVEKVFSTPPIVHVEKPGGGKVNVNVGAGVYMGGQTGRGKGSTGGRI
jgi:hypothetical protein